MNFALSDEQVLLREAARGALGRFKTVEAARDALENPDALPDLWPTAVEAGWPGLLIAEAACQAAARLVAINLGRRPEEPRIAEAAQHAERASELRARVLERKLR